MSLIMFHGSQESLDHIADRIKHHRLRRDPLSKTRPSAPQALIVDDDVESIKPLQLVLHHFGFDTTLAFDGKEALEEITQKKFDIVFLDICMPEMTGLEVLQKVESFQKHDSKYSKRSYPLPVVTYSSYRMADYDLPDGTNFYFADHWQKPVTLADLASLTGNMLNELGMAKSKNGNKGEKL